MERISGGEQREVPETGAGCGVATAACGGQVTPGFCIRNRTVHFCPDTNWSHLSLRLSDDGGHLLVFCRDALIAIQGAMGGDRDRFVFADGSSCDAEALLARLAL